MANLSTQDCQTVWTIIFFTCWQCSSFVMGNDDWLSHLSDEIQLKCEKSPPKSSKKEKLIFILRSTSDDWPSDPSNKSQPKCKKGPLSHQKIKCLFLDYLQLLVIGQAIQAMKVNQNMTKGPLSHQKMKYSFLYYIQFLMIGQAIRVMKVDQNAKKWNVVSVRVFCCLSLGVLLFQSGSSVVSVWVFSTPPPPRWKGRN